ncbi:MAG: hypothetical protein WA294_18620 [Acidobacteriaceae bacterium]
MKPVASPGTVPNLTLSQDARLYKYVRLPSGWKYLRADYSENFGLKPHSVFLPKTSTPTIVEGGKYVASDGGKSRGLGREMSSRARRTAAMMAAAMTSVEAKRSR